MTEVIQRVRKKYLAVSAALTERARRLWAGAEAEAIGRGGVAWVSTATGLAISTVRKGRDEVRAGSTLPLGRSRRSGAGRKPIEVKDPWLLTELESLVSPTTRGSPESPLRWTIKSLRQLAAALTKRKHPVSFSKVGELLRASGYSLQANSKTKEGLSHADRNAQFEHINGKARDFIARRQPVISVDAKKKEVLGQRASPGQAWEPRGRPVEVNSHDFFDPPEAPVAIPYGVYDLGENTGFVNVGTDHNTPSFAALSIAKWWERAGRLRYPDASELFVTADAGGSNACKSLVFKQRLQEFSDRTGLTIHVSHFPPGTSKWNKVEHRLFSFISLNWRARPLTSYEVVVALIAATTTTTGLRVTAELDTAKYPLGVAVSKQQLAALNLARMPFHGEWNYALRPRTPQQIEAAEAHFDSRPRKLTRSETHAKWREVLRQQLQSGMNAKAFCKQHGIIYKTFARARIRLVGKIRKLRRSSD